MKISDKHDSISAGSLFGYIIEQLRYRAFKTRDFRVYNLETFFRL